MAAPNIVNVATITAKSAVLSLTGTSATQLLENPASSDKVLKVNMILICNVDGTSAADITIAYYDQDDLGGTATEILSTVSVPADSTLVAIDKNTAIYLEENTSIGLTASAANDLKGFVSYEEISD